MKSIFSTLILGALALAAIGCGDADDDDDDATGGAGGSSGSGGKSSGGAGGSSGSGGSAGEAGSGGSGGPVDPGARAVNITPDRFFPEGVTVDKQGNFYIGSMDMGVIYKAVADDAEAMPFIAAGSNDLVSVLGLYADDATGTLWVCSSDAGNNARTGMAAVALKAFDLATGDPKGSWAWPEPATDTPITDPMQNPAMVNGFCNDITVDFDGNVYATDSWYPRILRLPAGATEATPLEEWARDPIFGADQWHLNGIDVDPSGTSLYVVENHPGHLYRVAINADGSAGAVTEITTSRALGGPDGLKFIAPNLLATAENNGVSTIALDGDSATVTEIFAGFDGVATLALHQASAWIVENQGGHFWDPTNNGPDATPPFRLVEVPLAVGAGAGIVEIDSPRFFPEGTTVDADGNFYIGSMDQGTIYKATAASEAAEPFIAAGSNDLVSVLGLYAHGASSTLWACSSDAGNGQLKGTAPVALKAFDLATGAAKGSWAWPAPSTTPITDPMQNPSMVDGFCNDIAVDSAGNVYATDSWYPRIVRLAAGATEASMLEEWVTNPMFGTDQWHLNGIDIDPAGANMYVVENHPGHLYRIAIAADGSAGTVTEIITSKPLRAPDGLKVINATTLAVAEGQPGGMALIELTGDTGRVRYISTGLDGVATFAMLQGSAWLVENQGDHFWNPTGAGANASKPFRLVEVPLGL
jgi:sugar lactone lactonase YvrE